MDYAPDGATFVTGADDGAIVLWDAASGAPLNRVLPGRPSDGWMTPTFLADGHTVLIASFGGAVYTMDTRPEHWVEVACAIAGRNLTEAEWSDAFGDRPYRETCPANTGPDEAASDVTLRRANWAGIGPNGLPGAQAGRLATSYTGAFSRRCRSSVGAVRRRGERV